MDLNTFLSSCYGRQDAIQLLVFGASAEGHPKNLAYDCPIRKSPFQESRKRTLGIAEFPM